jgi:hypothetical protein
MQSSICGDDSADVDPIAAVEVGKSPAGLLDNDL